MNMKTNNKNRYMLNKISKNRIYWPSYAIIY